MYEQPELYIKPKVWTMCQKSIRFFFSTHTKLPIVEFGLKRKMETPIL